MLFEQLIVMLEFNDWPHELLSFWQV